MERDIQNSKDYRQIPVNRVGVKDLHYPITVLDKANKHQSTVARVNMYVNLPQDFKGTHMSRFIEVLNEHHGQINVHNFSQILEDLMKSLNAGAAHIEMEFPYFIKKQAPVSREEGLMEYICSYIVNRKDGESEFLVGIQVPIATLCPCSKEMAKAGAHNQRGLVKVTLKFKKFFWIEDVIEMIEKSASAPVYSLLKREDEKYITELAYENPRFVEDVVREVTMKLKEAKNFPWFTVEAENFESIHNHNAYALVEWSEEK
jgi:GTP cyclohydrolase I